MTSRQSLGLSVLKTFAVTSVASQLNTEGACGYPENASALVTCRLGVFMEVCGARSMLQFVRENVCPNVKNNCFPFGKICQIAESGIFF